MNKRNSIIILAKDINLDKEYHNIIDYSESDRVSLCRSSSHLVSEQNNYSFLKIGENKINVGLPYVTCLKANYIAMQNPYYSNKWFFAFIDSVEYNSESSTNITYTIDELATWWGYWSKNTCYVEREHVNNDAIGLHTIPEGLETGDYICNGEEHLVFNEYCYLMNVSALSNGADVYATNVNGIWMSGGFYVFDDITSLISTINLYNDPSSPVTIDAIKNIYIVPKFLLNTSSYNTRWLGTDSPIFTSKTITKPTTINGYTPKNNKLFTSEYNYLLETNNNGSSNKFKYEYFSENPSFSIGGCATVGSSIISIPTNYNGGDEVNSLIAGKFPTCSWSEDAYTNWLTQNAVNVFGERIDPIKAGYGVAGIQALAGVGMLATGNVLGINAIESSVGNVFKIAQAIQEHEIIPNSFKGNINGGDFLTANRTNGFYFYKMSIKAETATSIDNFFTRFGYKVNILKEPNFTGRTYWNFVKIAGGEIIGKSNNTISVPERSMDIINMVFRKGTTIWHSHDNIGNYSLNNTIVTQ